MPHDNVEITAPGIKRALKKYKPISSIAEYIWNGFDAKANQVEIKFDINQAYIPYLAIKDNGTGIAHHTLNKTFRPFYDSEKEYDPNANRTSSRLHGKNGVGRLTFFKFANAASWETVYERNGKRYKYSIHIDAKRLNNFEANPEVETEEPTGTTVSFGNIVKLTTFDLREEFLKFLWAEFGWFLELNTGNKYQLIVNGTLLDYSRLIGQRAAFEHRIENQVFDVRYVRWKGNLHGEYSRYYLIGSDNLERFKETTHLNNKADKFYHSLYIKSEFFNKYDYDTAIARDEETPQTSFFYSASDRKVYDTLIAELDKYLRDKRRPFLKQYSDKIIQELEEAKAFPNFKYTVWEQFQREQLTNVVKELYQIEPKIFANLNVEQKKTFVHFLNVILVSDEHNKLMEVLKEILNLPPSELDQLTDLLKVTSMSNIIKTINLIADRYKTVELLQDLVFNKNFEANEPDHIQKAIEAHYWLFGEQYHLVTAAQPKFEEALRRFIFYLRGETDKVKITHPDKNREMDIFMVRQLPMGDNNKVAIKNVVIELKNPSIKLGVKELNQLKTYWSVIAGEAEFNASNMSWDFYLIGNEFNESGYIEGEIENLAHLGETSLVYNIPSRRCKMYVKTWSEIFVEFQVKHKFLLERLELQRQNLQGNSTTADEVVVELQNNSAIQPREITIPKIN